MCRASSRGDAIGDSVRDATGDAVGPAPSGKPTPDDIWAIIQRGSMPELQDAALDWHRYYSSYVRSYLKRDARNLVHVRDEHRFYQFMVACAARMGQLLNATDIAATVGIDVSTVRAWLSILKASGIVHIMQPFWANASKRLAKTPKLYFMDTGLACHLTGWNTPEQLRRGAMAGHLFEIFAVSEVLKSYLNAGRDTRDVSFYRDARKREIDLVVRDGRVLHPVEIKVAASVGADAVRAFSPLAGFPGYELGDGAVICLAEEP